MHQQKQQLTLMEKMNRWEWLVWLPALSLVAASRKDIGGRLLHYGYITGVTIIMFIWSTFATTRLDSYAIRTWAVSVFLLGFWSLFKRWREFRRGVKQHSFFLGSTDWGNKYMPSWIRSHRKVERFIEPLLFSLMGFLCLPLAPGLGLWFVFSSVCLLSVEEKTWRNWKIAQMDMVDGLVHSEFQGETVERFEKPQVKQTKTTDGFSSGIGDDIKSKIKKTKQNKHQAQEIN